MDKITMNPYLTFEGNCREAMNFYKEALNGELDVQTFENAPDPSAMGVPPEHLDKIMHARLSFGESVLMASDGMPGHTFTRGNDIHISLDPKTVEATEKVFNALSEGGQITMPLQDTFWGAKFGMFTDKFGINWMINCELPK